VQVKRERPLPPPRNTAARRAAENQRRIVELWLQRPKSERTADDVEKLYAWLLQHEPGLIPGGTGSYRKLRAILEDHLVERP
jgi:hypothetical protein